MASCATDQSLAVVDTASMASVGSPVFDGAVLSPTEVQGAVWVCVLRPARGPWTEGDLTRIDPDNLSPGTSKAVRGGAPVSLLSAAGSLWVTVEQGLEGTAWIIRLPITDLSD